MTDFDSNTFENDYILAVLQHMVTDLKTQKPVEQILDKYAVELTAFMNGRIRGVVKVGDSRVGVSSTSETLMGVRYLIAKLCPQK